MYFVQMAHEWKPPPVKEDSRWDIADKGGLIKIVLRDAMLYGNDRLQAVADIMQSWNSDGVTGISVTAEQLRVYLKKLLTTNHR